MSDLGNPPPPSLPPPPPPSHGPGTPPQPRPLLSEPWPRGQWRAIDAVPVFLMAMGVTYASGIIARYVLPLPDPAGYLVGTFVSELTIVALVLLWLKSYSHQPPKVLSLRRPSFGDAASGIGTGILIVIASGLATQAAWYIASSVLGHAPSYPTTFTGSLPGAWLIYAMPIIVVGAPLAEEVLFRGFLFQTLHGRFGGFGAAAISAIMFAFVHVSLIRIPGIFVGGLLLAWIFQKRRNLAASMFAHATLNAAAVAVILLRR